MSIGHIVIYLAILIVLALPFALAFILVRWLARRSRG